MLTQLSTVKDRLGLLETDPTYDTLLANAIAAVSARFDHECNRTLARTADYAQEFPGGTTRVLLRCAPLETVARFELKARESEGWIEQAGVPHLVRHGSILCLETPLGACREVARVIYTGGYVLPGAPPGPGQTPLPVELEHAAAEQVVWWFQNRDRLGLVRLWEYHGTYRQFGEQPLLPQVADVLQRFRRWTV